MLIMTVVFSSLIKLLCKSWNPASLFLPHPLFCLQQKYTHSKARDGRFQFVVAPIQTV